MNASNYRVVGLMSGTSLDGLDIALCAFSREDGWRYRILAAETIAYPAEITALLRGAERADAAQLAKAHADYGKWLGLRTREFLQARGQSADFIASHGHTIFHQPANGFTFQLGEGAALSVAAGLPVVCDFRTQDVARGGQGAPLVPVGDKLLFSEYSHCLNLGGIANISFDREGRRVAGDLSPCNLLLNPVAARKGLPYDQEGRLARAGKPDAALLHRLNDLAYYDKPLPKSLGREDLERDFYPLINSYRLSEEDLLATLTEHIASRVAAGVADSAPAVGSRLLLTGGGAWNTFLVERIRESARVPVEVPDAAIVNFKEALLFAFLGLLRWREEVNVLASVTGADRDHVAGAIYR